MKHQVKVIKTPAEYDAAVDRLSVLMSREIRAGSPDEAELELLALVIEAYERTRLAPIVTDPIEAIRFRMDQLGLKKIDLVPFIGSISKVSEVLSRKRPLSLVMIRKLHHDLGIAADVLLSDHSSAVGIARSADFHCSRFPLAEMVRRHYFAGFSGSLSNAKDHCEELVTAFLDSVDAGTPARLRAPLHQAGGRMMDEYALLTWKVAIMKKAGRVVLGSHFTRAKLSNERMIELARLSRFEQGPRLAQKFLADVGIALVFEDHFPKTYLDGAALLTDGGPVVALTLRHDRLDNFWFALMHELIHVQRHLNVERDFIADNLEDKMHGLSDVEVEADEGARDLLIPMADWRASAVSVEPTTESALALADRLHIHPAIVAGRVRYEFRNWRLLGSIRGSVRHFFADQMTP